MLPRNWKSYSTDAKSLSREHKLAENVTILVILSLLTNNTFFKTYILFILGYIKCLPYMSL